MKLVKNACKCFRNSAVQKLVYDTLIKSKTDFDSEKFKDCFQVVLSAIAEAKLIYSGIESEKDSCVFCHRQIVNSANKENQPAVKKKRRNYSIYSVKVDEQSVHRSSDHGTTTKEKKPKSKLKPKTSNVADRDKLRRDSGTFSVVQDDDFIWDYADVIVNGCDEDEYVYDTYLEDTDTHGDTYLVHMDYDYLGTSEDEEEELIVPEPKIRSEVVKPFRKLDVMLRDCKEDIINAWVFLDRLKRRF